MCVRLEAARGGCFLLLNPLRTLRHSSMSVMAERTEELRSDFCEAVSCSALCGAVAAESCFVVGWRGSEKGKEGDNGCPPYGDDTPHGLLKCTTMASVRLETVHTANKMYRKTLQLTKNCGCVHTGTMQWGEREG